MTNGNTPTGRRRAHETPRNYRRYLVYAAPVTVAAVVLAGLAEHDLSRHALGWGEHGVSPAVRHAREIDAFKAAFKNKDITEQVNMQFGQPYDVQVSTDTGRSGIWGDITHGFRSVFNNHAEDAYVGQVCLSKAGSLYRVSPFQAAGEGQDGSVSYAAPITASVQTDIANPNNIDVISKDKTKPMLIFKVIDNQLVAANPETVSELKVQGCEPGLQIYSETALKYLD